MAAHNSGDQTADSKGPFTCNDQEVVSYLLPVASSLPTLPLQCPLILLCKWGISFLHPLDHKLSLHIYNLTKHSTPNCINNVHKYIIQDM